MAELSRAFAVVVSTCISLVVFASPLIGQGTGLWTSAEELSGLPLEGAAWEALVAGASLPQNAPDLANQDDDTNVRVLASGIVFARTGDPAARSRVETAIESIVARGYPGGRTLAWGRESGAYALAADLVGYRTAPFEEFLRQLAETWVGEDGRTLVGTFRERPNNWGTHAFGSLAAIYSYLGDADQLRWLRDRFVLAVSGTAPEYRWGDDLSWHIDPFAPRLVNPAGAILGGMDVDGVLPDDMRRGGPRQEPPVYTGYPWEAMQGLILGARVLERAGLSVWEVEDRAILRAARSLEERYSALYGSEWKASGDDCWMLPFLDLAYGTNWSASQDRLWEHGKNAGWGYVTQRSASVPPPPTDSDADGMPDDWERKYALNPYDPTDASLDPDRDRFTNLQEYQKGTDPWVSDRKRRSR